MKERLIRKLAHAPWHAWLKEHPAWLELFAELLARLPEAALRKICLDARKLVILPPAYGGRIVRIESSMWRGANILQLDPGLLDRPRDEALGILAHELAHLCAKITDDPLNNDLAADHLAMSWGFRKELRKALQRDLEETHPRIVAAQGLPS